MNLLSINFGHDASLALFINGELAQFEELERASRLKHQFGVTSEQILRFMERANLGLRDIDLTTICCTQFWALPHSDDIRITFDTTGSAHQELLGKRRLGPRHLLSGEGTGGDYYLSHLNAQNITLGTKSPVGAVYCNDYIQGFDFPADFLATRFMHYVGMDEAQLREAQSEFFVPGTLQVRDEALPTLFVDHHYSHANYAWFYSPQANSIISTHDGGLPATPFNSGGIYITNEGGVIPIVDHRLFLGYLYDQIAAHSGVGGDAGKLMGLSSYSVADIHSLSIVNEIISQTSKPFDRTEIDGFLKKIVGLSSRRMLTREAKRDRFKFSDSISSLGIQMAANVQMVVENTFLYSVGSTASLLADMDDSYRILNLTGGFTLNCPTNCALKEQFHNLIVNPLPGCGDTGISIGAGVAAYKMLGLPLKRGGSQDLSAAFPPLKFEVTYSEEDYQNFQLVKHEFAGSIPEFIAQKVLEKKILCLFRGRSEVGPRALGRRSIIAHATDDEIRDKINMSKGREEWRPLAPICRDDDYHEYFEGNAYDSRFMLFTNRVKKPSLLKGVTHVDGSARAQAITDQDPWLYDALGIIKSKGKVPVIINTSFNCAGEPIVEAIQQAFKSFSSMNFDYLITEHGIFKKNS